MASQLIPVNVAAVLLLLAGTGLLVSEAYFTSHGLAGVAGAVCLVLGMLFFLDTSAPDQAFDPGALAVSPWLIWPTPVALAAVFAFMGLEGGARPPDPAPARDAGAGGGAGPDALRDRPRRGRGLPSR